ncbi:MAG: acyltransferase [Actinobacteria bacterium]|nr:acyltransferase [Actinomycetota bacterium]
MERIPALDGLRALAIAMVVGYHIDRDVVPAGFWGVLLFFVLSGYLITRLLIAERDRTGRVLLRGFYLRRALRLLPALGIVCISLLVVGIAWSSVLPVIGYYGNYARIAGVDLGLLTHSWSLAVEEHFYLVWPFVIGFVPARHRLRVVGGIAVAAIAWRGVAILVLSRGWVYNATDTNAAALLAGCWLAVARPPARRWAGWFVPALLALVFVPAFGTDGPLFAWGGFLAIALSAAAVQFALTRPSVLEGRVIVWVGKVSYGLYLWHYVFVRSDLSTWVALACTLAATTASWYLVEVPIRRWRSRLERRHPSLAGSSPAPAGP